MEVDAEFPKGVEVGEDLLDSGDVGGFAGDLNGIRAEIDRDVEFIFEEPEIFVVGPI